MICILLSGCGRATDRTPEKETVPGVDVKTVQHNLGHKSASITLDTYAAYTSDAGKEGAKKLSDYLKNAGK